MDVDSTVIEHTHKIKTLETRVDKLEKVVEQINKLTVSIEKMTLIQEQMLGEQKAQRADINKIKEQPGKDAHDLKIKIVGAIITTVLGAILGALIALVIK